MSGAISITFVNASKNKDVQALVFSKNIATNTPEIYYAAWQVLQTQSSIGFSYPVDTGVGATYPKGTQTVKSGPFTAPLGSTWDIEQPTEDATVLLVQDTKAPKNPNNTIIVKNTIPKQWSGRKYNVGIYKDRNLFLVEKDVVVGNQVDFELEPKLFFVNVTNFIVGKIFKLADIGSTPTEFDLQDYPHGLTVTMTEDSTSGKFIFTGSASSK